MGEIFRGILINVWNSRKFKLLSKDEKLLLLYLRTSPLSNLSRIYRIYLDAVVEHTGIPLDEVRRIMDNLSQKGWIIFEEGIVWDKDGLHDDPFLSLKNEKHTKAIQNDLSNLEQTQIVTEFRNYYHISIPYTDGYQIPNRIQEREVEKEEKKKEKEVEAVREGKAVPHMPDQASNKFAIPLIDNTEYVITDNILLELKASFPSIDVERILTRIERSHRKNPKERLTKHGITHFLTKILQSEATK